MRMSILEQVSVFKVLVNTQTQVQLLFIITVFVDENNHFSCDVERQDSYRLKTSFQTTATDEEVYVNDVFFKTAEQSFNGMEELKLAFIAEIQSRFAILPE